MATPGPTVASACVVSGDRLASGIVREPNSFLIVAHDALGARRTEGGDHFFTSVRTRGDRVRARVTDNDDGSYSVVYKPIVSGVYVLTISLYGEPLPGSPFSCEVGTPTPCCCKCVLHGAALTKATARMQQQFEVQFRDGLGQMAHAEELDVYVERLPSQPPGLFATCRLLLNVPGGGHHSGDHTRAPNESLRPNRRTRMAVTSSAGARSAGACARTVSLSRLLYTHVPLYYPPSKERLARARVLPAFAPSGARPLHRGSVPSGSCSQTPILYFTVYR